jgi:hypothetical protein
MGTYYTSGASRRDIIAELVEGYSKPNNQGQLVTRTVLAHCCVGNILWTANEVTVDGVLEDRWIGCDALNRGTGDGWGYKPMDEDMGPYYFSCPVSYLDMATPHKGSEYSVKWRENVREFAIKHKAKLAARRQARKARGYYR